MRYEGCLKEFVSFVSEDGFRKYDVTVSRDHDMSPVGEDMELLKMTGRTRSPFYCYRSGRDGHWECESG